VLIFSGLITIQRKGQESGNASLGGIRQVNSPQKQGIQKVNKAFVFKNHKLKRVALNGYPFQFNELIC
jgi:hypothetical protein